jgi:hypothetical protein
MQPIYLLLAGLTIILAFVLWRALKLLVPLLVAILRGEKTAIWISGRQQKCPHCGAPIDVSEIRKGEAAFRCASCGTEATWQ